MAIRVSNLTLLILGVPEPINHTFGIRETETFDFIAYDDVINDSRIRDMVERDLIHIVNLDKLGAVRVYPSSATDPLTPVPSDGDEYYNTILKLKMVYDGSRSKWLSSAEATFQIGRNWLTAAGSFYRGINGMALTDTRGYVVRFNGTVVAFSYSRSNTDLATFEIRASGSPVATLVSSVLSGYNNSLNGDFSQGGILSVLNQIGGNTTSFVQGWVTVRWGI